MVPDGYVAEDLRAVPHKIFSFKNNTGVPLAFYKQYAFQLRQRAPIPGGAERWDYYCLEQRCPTDSTHDASRGLQSIYLSESMIFAWKYSISKRDAKQTEKDWLLQQTINQLFYKAKMHKMTADTKTWTHLIYTFKPMKMRPYYPMESDYVASCRIGEKAHLQPDGLELHGTFAQEYDKMTPAERDLIFRQVLLHLNACIRRYVPEDADERKKMMETPTTK